MSVRRDLPFSTMVWQAHPSAWMLTVVCKCTFDLHEGELSLSATQEGVHEYDRYWEDDRERSLVSASDLVPIKHTSDVVLVGHAFAPDAGVARSVVARLSVGTIDKSIEVHVERVVGQDGVVVEGAPFSRVRIVYERAAGGPGTWNPAGIRPGTCDAYGRVILPNVTAPGRGAPPHAIEPIGFGPMAPSWPLRSERAGHHAAVLGAPHWRERPLPADLDPSYFNVAPLDQRLALIPENAPIVLENLHPRIAVLRTRLPGLRPRVICERRGARVEVELRTDTLSFDTERALCTLSWRGQMQLEHPAEVLPVHVELDPLGAHPPAVTRSQESIRHGVLPFAAMAHRAAPVPSAARGGLPFGQEPGPVRPPREPAPMPVAATPSTPRAIVESRSAPAADTDEVELLQLLWFDSDSASGISANPEWKKIVDDLVDTTRDPQVDQPGFGEDPSGTDERRQVFEVLSRGAAAPDEVDVQNALAAGVRKDGSFEPRLVLVSGEVRFDFDEMETVKAHVAAAIPFAQADSALEKVIDEVTQFLRAPSFVVSPDVLEGMSKRIQNAFAGTPRTLGLEYLAEQTERALVGQQAFQRRDVFGAMYLRALLFYPQSEGGLPLYLREDLAKRLPLFRRLPVRMLVEVRFQEDQSERRDIALRALAVARVIRTKRPRR